MYNETMLCISYALSQKPIEFLHAEYDLHIFLIYLPKTVAMSHTVACCLFFTLHFLQMCRFFH